jgi:hypothetical protein
VLTSCPREGVTEEVFDALRVADWAERGMWPEAGGWLDQPAAVLQAVQVVRAAEIACDNAELESKQ